MIQFRDLHINDIIITYKKGNPFEELPLYTVRNIIKSESISQCNNETISLIRYSIF